VIEVLEREKKKRRENSYLLVKIEEKAVFLVNQILCMKIIGGTIVHRWWLGRR
jgi:hypothetical protein